MTYLDEGETAAAIGCRRPEVGTSGLMSQPGKEAANATIPVNPCRRCCFDAVIYRCAGNKQCSIWWVGNFSPISIPLCRGGRAVVMGLSSRLWRGCSPVVCNVFFHFVYFCSLSKYVKKIVC